MKKNSIIRRIWRTVGLLALLGAVMLALAGWSLSRWAYSPAPTVMSTEFELRRGTSLAGLAQQLNDAGLIDRPVFFQAWVRLFSDYPRFQAGLYKFEGQVPPTGIIEKIINGDIYEPIVVQYTIPEGFNINLIARRLEANGVGTYQSNMQLFHNPRFLQSLNLPSRTLEGFFYPATYQFVRRIDAQQATRHAVDTFWKKAPHNYEQRAKALGLSLVEAVAFASMIEVETKHDDEKPKIAEVIWRRLKNKEPLGIDAALIYGIPNYNGDIKSRHLTDKKNLYNNRIYRGLPPTPISSPDASSLNAVLNPSNEGYYYYVYDADTRDRHHFSKTLAEHNRYVKKLVAATRGKHH